MKSMDIKHIEKDEHIIDQEEDNDVIGTTGVLCASLLGGALMSLELTLMMDIGDALRNDLSIPKFFLSLLMPGVPALLCLLTKLINLFYQKRVRTENNCTNDFSFQKCKTGGNIMFLSLTQVEAYILHETLFELLQLDKSVNWNDTDLLNDTELLCCIHLAHDISFLKYKTPAEQLIEISLDAEQEKLAKFAFGWCYEELIYDLSEYEISKSIVEILWKVFPYADEDEDGGYYIPDKSSDDYNNSCQKLKEKQQELYNLLSLDDEKNELWCYMSIACKLLEMNEV